MFRNWKYFWSDHWEKDFLWRNETLAKLFLPRGAVTVDTCSEMIYLSVLLEHLHPPLKVELSERDLHRGPFRSSAWNKMRLLGDVEVMSGRAEEWDREIFWFFRKYDRNHKRMPGNPTGIEDSFVLYCLWLIRKFPNKLLNF